MLFSALICLFIYLFSSCRKEAARESNLENNNPPVANAGRDTAIVLPLNNVSLDGSNSNDPDGIITEFLWSKISGPSLYAIDNSKSIKTIAKNLTYGVYQFELKVTDDGGLSAKDTLMITVDSVCFQQS